MTALGAHPRLREPEVGDRLLPHAHRGRRAHRHAERARLRRAGAARRHGAEAARPRDAAVPQRAGRHPRGHRRRRARPRHRSRVARHQLRPADGARSLRAPHRPHRPHRPRRRGDHAGQPARAPLPASSSRRSPSRRSRSSSLPTEADLQEAAARGHQGSACASSSPKAASTTCASIVESLAQEFDVLDVAAAAVKMIHDAFDKGTGDGEVDEGRRRPRDRSRRPRPRAIHEKTRPRAGRARSGPMTLLRLSVGKEESIRPGRPRRRDRRRSQDQLERHRRHQDPRRLLAGRDPGRAGRTRSSPPCSTAKIRGHKVTVQSKPAELLEWPDVGRRFAVPPQTFRAGSVYVHGRYIHHGYSYEPRHRPHPAAAGGVPHPPGRAPTKTATATPSSRKSPPAPTARCG